MEIKKFVDKIRNIGYYKKLFFFSILLLIDIFFDDKHYRFLSDGYRLIWNITAYGGLALFGIRYYFMDTNDDDNEENKLFSKLKQTDDPFIIFLDTLITIIIISISIALIMCTSVVASLKYSNEPYITSKATIVHKQKRMRKRSPYAEFLLANGTIIIIRESNYMILKTNITADKKISNADKGDCFNLKHRQNKRVMEIRLIENLGKMSQQECLSD